MKLAPLAIFVYNRPDKIKKVLNSLKKNKLCEKTSIFFFSDGPKNKKDQKQVEKVRTIIKNFNFGKHQRFFFHKKNRGLKKNITDGISKIFKKFNKIIVLEDDIIVSPSFLHFMNSSLNRYYKEKNIWHISSWNYSLNLNNDYQKETFFWRNMNCWGWATWKNRWLKLNLNPDFFIKKFDKHQIEEFDLDGKMNNWSQLERNKLNVINTWAVFWNATIFYNKGLCLNPVIPFSKNIGFDERSTNTKEKLSQHQNLNFSENVNFPLIKNENNFFVKKIKKKLIKDKIKNKVGRYFRKFIQF